MWTLLNEERDVATRTKKPTKKPASKGTKKVASKATTHYKTFRIAKPKQPFMTFKVTKQTIYWTILVAFVIVMQLWILAAQYDVVQTTDQLQQQINTINGN